MSRLDHKKYLIADDHAAMRKLIGRILRKISPELFQCSNGVEAVRLYAQERPDWVLMDIRMAPMDGLTATRQIRARFPGARVLVVTSIDDVTMREEAERAGARGYLLKKDLARLPELLNSLEL